MNITKIDIEKYLKNIRKSNASLPNSNLLDYSPISIQAQTDYQDKDINLLANKIRDGMIVAFDLDETIINNSYMCKELNSFSKKIIPSIKYNQMKISLIRFFKYFWRLPRRFWYDPREYPFLKNPYIISQVRPGMLSLLQHLKKRGCELILVSSTAKKRMDFLINRLPILKEVFSHVICAEDILKTSFDIKKKKTNKKMSKEDKKSLIIHKKRPLSLAMKTPYLVKKITGLEYDLLVDDSDLTFRMFKENGLRDKIIRIKPKISQSICFEDPLYYPLIHIKDQINPSK